MDVLSLSERLRKEAAFLGKKKGREAARQFLIEGVRSVEAAIEGGAALVHILVHDRLLGDARVQVLLEKAGVPVYQMDDKQEKRISTVDTSPGCIAVARFKQDALADILDAEGVIVLDGIQDPGNAGTIIRTAAWFGVDAVLIGAGSVDVADLSQRANDRGPAHLNAHDTRADHAGVL